MSITTTASTAHIFLSHSGVDTTAAHELAKILRRNGLEVWFDKDSLQPGEPWMTALEQNIQRASAMLVYVGRQGVQSWVDREVRLGLVRNTQEHAFRLIPVLGDGADPSSLPPFLSQHQWVDLRDPQHAPEEIRRIVEAFRKSSAKAAIPSQYWATHSPFRSLQVFEPEDSWLFFGRDSETNEVLSQLSRTPLLAIIGNSGSGKSSLIRAGLIPALQRGRFSYQSKFVESWQTAFFRPSQTPFDYLAETLPEQIAPKLNPSERADFIQRCRARFPQGGKELRDAIAAIAPKGTRILLVADQFEELFTLTQNLEIRTKYLDLLLAASGMDGPVPVHLIIALRADFYSHCLEHRQLSQCLAANLYNVPRIEISQLRETIENRLALADARSENGLVDSLLAEVGTEPGNLALLEHALDQLWATRGPANILTNRAYTEMGRLRGALGRHADKVFREIGGETEQRLVQTIFLELVQLGEGSPDTRRRVTKETLYQLGDRAQIECLLSRLSSERLIHIGRNAAEDYVEVSHEALIREWPTFQRWLAVSRDDIRLERRLKESADEWHRLEYDPGSLLHGVRLAQAEEWIQKRGEGAGDLVSKFVKVSGAARAEMVRRELEAQQRTRRSAIRFRLLSYVLIVLLLVALGATWFAHEQQLIAESRSLAAQSEATLSHNRPLAVDLALRARQTAKTSEADLAILHSFPQLATTLQGHTEPLESIVFSPDGQRILTASWDRTARVWNAGTGKLEAILKGHSGPVLNAAFSPDGQRILTASWDGTARVWNAGTGKLEAILKGHAKRVQTAIFSPDTKHILTTSEDNTARVWNGGTGKLEAILEGHSDMVWSAVFSRDGQRILTASWDKTARVWNAATGKLLSILEGHSDRVWTAVFSPDGQRIVTASEDKSARLWNAATGEQMAILQGHSNAVLNAVFSPDGQRIVTASEDKTARLWNAATGEQMAILQGHLSGVLTAVFSTDGQYILTASRDNTARVWDLASRRLLAVLQGHSDSVSSAVFSPDGQRALTASDDKTVRVWNLVSAQLLAILKGHSGTVYTTIFSPDGQRILTPSSDMTARVWDAADNQLLTTLKGHSHVVWSAVFSPDGRHILTASEDNTARVWNAATGQLLMTIEGHHGALYSAVFSPDGRHILTASEDNTARVWNAVTGQLLRTLEGHSGSVYSAVFSPNGQVILTASGDKTAKLWNAATGQPLVTLEGHSDVVRSAAFSPDGQRIVTASGDKTARLWSAATGRLLATLEGHSDFVRSAVFSPDGQRIVTASEDKTARLWNAATGEQMAILQGHSNAVFRAVFSPDGQRIVTASRDETGRVWNGVSGQPLAILEGHFEPVRQGVFSPDGKHILTASDDHTVRIFRLITLSEIAQMLGH